LFGLIQSNVGERVESMDKAGTLQALLNTLRAAAAAGDAKPAWMLKLLRRATN
jgi:hypothetical protein